MKQHLPLWLLIIAAALLAHRAQRTAHPAPAPVGACAGDFTGDRTVDGADLSILLANFGVTEATADPPNMWTRGDLNDDGHINGQDITILIGTFGCYEWEDTGFAAMGPPSDFVCDDLEPWTPGMFTAEIAESAEEGRDRVR